MSKSAGQPGEDERAPASYGCQCYDRMIMSKSAGQPGVVLELRGDAAASGEQMAPGGADVLKSRRARPRASGP